MWENLSNIQIQFCIYYISLENNKYKYIIRHYTTVKEHSRVIRNDFKPENVVDHLNFYKIIQKKIISIDY